MWAELVQESTAYPARVRRGWARGRGYVEAYPRDKLAAHKALLVVAEREFGRQPPSVTLRIEVLADVEQFMALVDWIYYSAEGLDLLEAGREQTFPRPPITDSIRGHADRTRPD